MHKVVCPRCEYEFLVGNTGRKRKEIPVNKLLDALRKNLRPDGSVSYAQVARELEKSMGIRVGRGFVHNRITQLADEKGLTREKFVAGVKENG